MKEKSCIATRCWARYGATTPRRRRERWTITSRPCAPRWSRIRRRRGICSRCMGWATSGAARSATASCRCFRFARSDLTILTRPSTPSPMTSDFLAIPDFTRAELESLLDLAERMKAGKFKDKPLAGKTLAMIFMKASTRTRVSFEVGTYQLGGHALFLSPRDVQLGRGEPIADTARVLARYVDGIMIRTFAHQDAEELAQYAEVPVINGLTDLVHPCQVLADLLTVRTEFGAIADKKYAWIGDGNNMANSWINAAYRFGFDLDIACPEGYEPADHLLARAQKVAKVRVVRDPMEAARGAQVINTDVWASMGQEQESKDRERAFKGFTVSPLLMSQADPKAIFLHCLS